MALRDCVKGLQIASLRQITALSLLMPISLATKATATPAEIFIPHLERIRQLLPPGLMMRLPSQILLGGPADNDFIQQLLVRVSYTNSPPLMTVDLSSCANRSPTCSIGSFSVASGTSTIAQRDFQQHVAGFAPIQLSKEVRGYLLEKSVRQPPFVLSSVMWQQDGMFYTIRFATPERQNMLYMAVSMVNNQPISAHSATVQNP